MTTLDTAAHALVQTFSDALNAGDAAALSTIFTDDAQFVNILALRMRGRSGIEAAHAHVFRTLMHRVNVAFHVTDVTPLGEGAGIAYVEWVRGGSSEPGPNTLPPGKGVITFVLVKQDDRWLVQSGHNTQHAAPPGAPPAS